MSQQLTGVVASQPSMQSASQAASFEPEQKALWGQVSVSESFRAEKDASISRLNARFLVARCWGRGWCESMETQAMETMESMGSMESKEAMEAM